MLRDTIYTIPINDVFTPKCGCPVCRMRDMLEERAVDYILGPAMMEPDIRIETNKSGFCKPHFEMMQKQQKRLQMALILETHIDEILNNYIPYKGGKNATPLDGKCYICNEIENAMRKMLSTTVKLYCTDSGFKQLVDEQQYFCFPHYELLCSIARDELPKKQSASVVEGITEITKNYLSKLRDDVHAFTLMYDYRNMGKKEESEEVKNSIERTIAFLTARE